FHEFIFGLLENGEVLIDDIQIIKDPTGEAIQVIQNGTFESDELGSAPASWRIIGNHSGVVVADPTNPDNKVLRVTATGAQAHIHDHAETTFTEGQEIVIGANYEISFRAKWINGSSQLNSRLFYNRIPDTLNLHVPDQLGTPGTPNSASIENAGPTFTNFGHDITTPAVGQAVTVSVNATDPNGVESVRLLWREDGGDWNNTPMQPNALGTYQAQIPGHGSGTIVQFYAEATDSLGATATFPAQGPDSRALLQVADGQGPLAPIDTVRIIIMKEDQERLYESVNRMSNWLIPITLVHNRTSFYDVATRQVGSRWIRPNSGYKVRLHPDQPFYGVHDTIRLDMNGMAEIVMKQMINRAGGIQTSYYDDIAYLVIPFHPVQTTRDDQPHHTHEILLNLARLESVFLDEQFENGSEGTRWELDDVVYPSAPLDRDPEGLKADTTVIETADIGVSTDITYVQGNDPEFYRAHILIKNQRVDDRFDVIKAFAQAIHQSDDKLFEAANEVMDVDQWMRHYANQAYFGNWDTYGFRRPKNLRFYQRPNDGKIIPFFWDCDLCNFTERLFNPTEPTSRLDEIRAIPHNLRLFWGHLLDYTNRSFNVEYVERWAKHYGELASSNTFGGDETFESITRSTETRTARVLEELNEAIPPIDFAVTTENGTAFDSTAMIEGTGWVNVRRLRVVETGADLDAYWPTTTAWQANVSLLPGDNTLTIEAIDFEGNSIGTSSLTVSSTTQHPALHSLRISEIHYNPARASEDEQNAGFGNDDFEFVELVNTSDTDLSLDGVRLERVTINGVEQGIDVDFNGMSIPAGGRLVVVEDEAAFRFRYGADANVAAQWSGALDNNSETLTLIVNGSIIQQFAYSDEWYPSTDGDGTSLVIVDPNGVLELWSTKEGWSHSGIPGGSPGENTGRPGDVNGDGVFDSSDLVAVLQAGEFEDAIDGNSTFAEGDWNGDG
ncbi:MAG: lamin tail domain-containing protein, partial [Planctomycetales bacterium]|nr:lamin tail domain-containing protein [Planctomycetales bacterium]